MVAPAAPIDLPLDRGSGQERLLRRMPDLSLFIFLDRQDGRVERRAAGRGGSENPSVVRLAAAHRVKRSAVERDLPQRLALGSGDLADIGDARWKGSEKRFCVIEPLRHKTF